MDRDTYDEAVRVARENLAAANRAVVEAEKVREQAGYVLDALLWRRPA